MSHSERKLTEITREKFWALEDAIVAQRHLSISGTVILERNGENKKYKNSEGIWLRSFDGKYFAHSRLLILLD